MITFTKEQLIARINQVTAINKYRISRDPAAEGLAMDNELLAIALALLEAEKGADPVAFINGAWTLVYYRPPKELGLKIGDKLYTAPPAPVSVPDDGREQFEAWFKFHHGDEHSIVTLHRANGGLNYRDPHVDLAWIAWKDSRAAMLQGAEPVTTAYKLPMQPLVIDDHGTLRFKENPIVRALLDYATEHGYGLNEIALEELDAEDQMQLAQLIGYSLSGYGTLSYVTDESYERAAAAAPQQEVK